MGIVFHKIVAEAERNYESGSDEFRVRYSDEVTKDAEWHEEAHGLLDAGDAAGFTFTSKEDCADLRKYLCEDVETFNAQPAPIRATVVSGLQAYAEAGLMAILGM